MRIYFLAILAFCVCSLELQAQKVPLVLISIDGFSHQYLEKYQPKNLLALANTGVSSEGLLPVYPSKTFPNHLSIVTGVYPVKHGIVHNYFFNRALKTTFKKGGRKAPEKWLTAQPIWSVAQQQGLKSAIYFWPESETKVAGRLPDYVVPYNGRASNTQRIDQIIKWLKFPKNKRPDLLLTYFSTVDSAGHHFGQNSKQVATAVYEIDKLIGQFYQRIKNEIETEVNVLIVSDHGMTFAGQKNAILVKDIIATEKDVIVVSGETQLYIYSDNKIALAKVHKKLLLKQNNGRNFNVYTKEQFPAHWHLTQSTTSTPDIIVEAKPPVTFVSATKYANSSTHGYDPKNIRDLDGIFIATGPSFKDNITINSFENIHIFPLLIKLLSLENTQEIDGNLNVLLPILK